MSAPARLLDYAPKPPLHRRRRVRWVVATTVGLPLILAAAYAVGTAVVQRAKAAREAQVCLDFTVPSGTKVYEEDADGTAAVSAFVTLPPPVWDSIFIHGRRAAGGPQRLVIVSTADQLSRRTADSATPPPDLPVLRARVVRPATWAAGEAELSSRAVGVGPLSAVPYGGLRFYAGQPDPIDLSHFTIDYDTPDGVGTLDGYLMPDDSVKIEARDGPAAR